MEKEIEQKLKAPFLPNEIEWRITAKSADKTKGLAVAYITNRAIQNRLDEVVGFSNWKNEFIVNGNSKICGLSIRINNEWITKYDGADDTDIESTKGGISNSMKRAAVQWGIGRYLYSLSGQWVKIKPQGKSYIIDENPKLPDWALPENYEKPKVTKQWTNKKETKKEIAKPVQDCIKAFEKIGVSKEQLENYLHTTAELFTDLNLGTLRTVYHQIKHGKPKEDFFGDYSYKKGDNANRLDEKLQKIAEESEEK